MPSRRKSGDTWSRKVRSLPVSAADVPWSGVRFVEGSQVVGPADVRRETALGRARLVTNRSQASVPACPAWFRCRPSPTLTPSR